MPGNIFNEGMRHLDRRAPRAYALTDAGTRRSCIMVGVTQLYAFFLVAAGFPACLSGRGGRLGSLLPPGFLW